MGWNYRIFENDKGDEKYYSIREVYYTDDNEIRDYTKDDITPYGETPEVLFEVLEMMLKDAKKTKHDILTKNTKTIGWD